MSDDRAGGARRCRGRADEEDAAAVLTVLAAIAAGAAATAGPAPQPRTVWALPRFREAAPGPHAWWSSGLHR